MGGKKQQNVALIGFGAVALGLLGYVAWKSSKAATPSALQTGYVGGVPVPSLTGVGIMPSIQPYYWQVPQGLRDYLAGSQLTLGGTYGFTRIGLDQPVFTLKPGTGFTII